MHNLPTTISGIVRLIDAMPRVPGLRNVRMALQMALEGSASPAETKLATCLFLPRHKGGAGFPAAQLNYESALPPNAARMAGERAYRCDYAWPSIHVGIEYNSKMHHADNAIVTANDIRKKTLEYCGLRIIVAKPYHLFNYQGFIDLETQIAHSLGMRLRPMPESQKQVRAQFRKELFVKRREW